MCPEGAVFNNLHKGSMQARWWPMPLPAPSLFPRSPETPSEKALKFWDVLKAPDPTTQMASGSDMHFGTTSKRAPGHLKRSYRPVSCDPGAKGAPVRPPSASPVGSPKDSQTLKLPVPPGPALTLSAARSPQAKLLAAIIHLPHCGPKALP